MFLFETSGKSANMDASASECTHRHDPAAAMAYATSEPSGSCMPTACCESFTGGALAPGASMVPPSDAFSTPLLQPGAFAPGTCGYPPHGPLPPATHFLADAPASGRPVLPTAPPHAPVWPAGTPGAAYVPYMPHTPPQYDPRDGMIASLTAQLQSAVSDVQRLSLLVRNQTRHCRCAK